jgi:hypothetical protein
VSSNVRVIRPRVDWRESQADALEAAALTIDDALARLTGLEELFERDQCVLRALRTCTGYLRSRRNDRLDEAGRLRAAAHDDIEQAAGADR